VLRQARARLAEPTDLNGRIARAALDAALSSSARSRADREMLAKLASDVPLERVVLPFVFTPRIGPADLETLADRLDGF
jgi:hypothetical protein